ncbi:alanine--tRNA ligase [Lacticaseibacillus manihotivorans]|uniref:Alanine--tRNA ligase n=2 Tax=Lacticaseibacillus manihotivorans TaxID=88233 RepID=A0A0R1QR40_9LACO|nr:alanine--tRNA ligase [Lacticaseibacillus manihotivorans]KRL47174.1 alanyl-tRNA synthetase [Lacticaseibacillus manihotivorans DSM 13343 = JCM 12514]QFQ90486.1 alanine--tRNA ligase [Lacticaseibacillus manihotivorans]
MKQLNSAQIRQMFLDFFKSKGHDIEPSASLIPVNDPSLLWINSGVATLKKYFDGSVIPKNPRITNAQKSIRTNDIENVGKTARHLTFFEMLGNFSVGDYFKPEVIPWAWEFLTSDEWLGLDKDKLYVTVYPKDTEAKRIWHEVVGLSEDRIFDVEDNFWDIGVGPCGPDSEIFFDRGQSFNDIAEDDPENYPGGENERYEEIWNIVFSEFNHLPDGRYVDQPHKNIDTGMGLERLVSVIEGTRTNFETDLFMPIIEKTESLSAGKKYNANDKDDVSFKIIADHARTVTFAIGDGALPSNEGRGYVLRRLIRRAVLNGKKLGIEKDFLYQLVPVVGEIMQSYYPEVLKNKDFIEKVIRSEEARFRETLDAGVTMLNQTIAKVKADGKTVIPGADAFKLFDTFGFPVEMTAELAEDDGLTVDMDGYKENMQAQRDRARAARGDAQSMGNQDKLLMSIETASKFTGWTDTDDDAKLMNIIVDDTLVDHVEAGVAQVIFGQTPFYAEMGGQVADHGDIVDENGAVVAKVTDVQHAPNGQNLHTVDVEGHLETGATYHLQVELTRRQKVSMNHTATHLLDTALRQVLGDHTHQAGSLVEPDYLRFDFTNFGQVTPEQLKQVEEIVNTQIWRALPITWKEMPIEDAKKEGAIAMFGDKYGDTVRVVTIGDFNKEFDGGTHPTNTSALGLFKITGESGIGAGTRRIEAVTSKEAFEYLTHQENLLNQVAQVVKSEQLDAVPAKVASLQSDLKAAHKEVEALQAKLASQQASGLFDSAEPAGKYSLIKAQLKVAGMNELRQLADQWKTKNASDVLVLATEANDKANLLVAVSDAAIKQGVKAGNIIKAIAPKVQGGGGGRPDMAQAGGKNPAGIPDALAEAVKVLAEL